MNDTSLPLVIVNPKSASGSTRDRWATTASELRTHFGPFNVAFTKAAGDGITLAKRAAESGRRFVIACGGDGTINEVANGILLSGVDVEVGVLPSGTGGDLRRTLSFPSGAREAAIALRTGTTKRMDAGRVSFTGNDGEPAERFFLNVSSVGLAALVIKRVKSTKLFDWLPAEAMRGKANFAVSSLQEILEMQPAMLRVRIDEGEEHGLQTIAFCVANSRYFGGGMMIAPEAKLDDGLLNIVNIADMSIANLVLKAHTLYRGTHGKLSEVHMATAKRISVAAADPDEQILIETDGETPGRLPAKFEIMPQALRIRVPAE